MRQIELSPKQCEYINKANHRYNGKIGATQCGKTHIDVAFVIVNRIMERRGQKGLNLILGVTKETIERNVLEPMRDIWGEDNITEINNRNVCFIFGEKVYCLGAEKVSQVSKLRGAKFKYVYIDEIVDIHQEVFDMLKSRLSLEYSVCDFTGNPSYPQHYVKEFIDSDADVWCQQWTLYDNPFIPDSYVKSLETEYAGTVYFDRYILGRWKNAEGSIYQTFANNPKKHLTDKPNYNFIQIGLDFGGNKSSFAFVASGLTWNYKKLTALASKKIPAKGVDPDKLYAEFIQFVRFVIQKYGEINAIYADSAEQTLINGLRAALERAGIYIPVKNSIKNEINDRIEATVIMIALGIFEYTEDCQTLVDALCTAVYNPKKFKDERLDDGTSDIDTMDAFEYSWERYMRNYVKW